MNPSLLESQFEALEEPKQAITVDVAAAPKDVVISIREKLSI
jgi:gluconate kinase